jgi:hypothetical protein
MASVYFILLAKWRGRWIAPRNFLLLHRLLLLEVVGQQLSVHDSLAS